MRRDEALQRAAMYLTRVRDQAITAETTPPDDLNEIIATLGEMIDQESQRRGGIEDLEFADLPGQPRQEIAPPEN